MSTWVQADSAFGSVAIDLAIGNVRKLSFRDKGRDIVPLHAAHWADDPSVPQDLPPVERNLAGDFFCAPFGASDVEPAPPHGWSANSAWSVIDQSQNQISLSLDARVLGATITKTLHMSADAPVLMQIHHISGGSGGLTVAHHPMVRVAGGATLSVSPKRSAQTPDTPLDAGRNALTCPAQSRDLAGFPASDGGTIDLTHLPIAQNCEDFVTLIEAEDTGLGWTAIVRDAEDDIVFFLKDPRVLPVTMLWHSNGGRDYAPWHGQHRGILGIEDGCAAGAAGHQAALGENAVARTGVATFLPLGSHHTIAHVTGAINRPKGWSRIANIHASDGCLTLTDQTGDTRTLSFPSDVFKEIS